MDRTNSSGILRRPGAPGNAPPAWPSTDADATIAACSLDFVRSRLQDRPELRHSWLTRAVVASTLLTSILGVTNRLDPLAQGLKAEYFSDTSATSPPVASTL